MGLIDKLDFTERKLWRSVDVINEENMDEPHVLQQQIVYPTTSMQTETTAPTEKHRLVPLSKVTEDSDSEDSFWDKLSEAGKEA
jgi:hypothetical protein